MIKQTISHYKILEKLGEGGMGVVYKAEDTRLHRTVALKFLPPHLTKDEEAKTRFITEAQAASALDHQNICTIFDIKETEDEQLYIVMAYYDGETLGERVARGELRVEEATDIARQIAAGLARAHEAGITHRDIKPSNIMITDREEVKILDFGIARIAGQKAITKTGATLGTIAYMSPEQVRGEPVDNRTDIWSLGVIFYEMLTGKLPFDAEYDQAVMYSILNKEYDPPSALRSGVPVPLDAIMAKTLAKDPTIRYQHVDELPADLKAIQTASERILRNFPVRKAHFRRTIRSWAWAIAAILVALLVGASVWEWLRPESSNPISVARFRIPLPDSLQIPNIGTPTLALSPDGKYLVFVGTNGNRRQLYLRPIDALEFRPIPGTEGASTPFFSPDGEWIGFFSRDGLRRVPTTGGSTVDIARASGMALGATWSRNNLIVYTLTAAAELFQVHLQDNAVKSLTAPDPEKEKRGHRYPHFLPGGDALLFQGNGIKTLSLKSGEEKFVVDGNSPIYLPQGYLLFGSGSAGWLRAARFDLARLELTGKPISVFSGIKRRPTMGSEFTASASGNLVYLTAEELDYQLILVDRNGNENVISDYTGGVRSPRFSPDGRRLAFLNNGNVWIYEFDQNTASQLTFSHLVWSMEWRVDGKQLIIGSNYKSGTFDIYSIATDFSGKIDTLVASEYDIGLGSLSYDSQWLVFVEPHPQNGRDIWALPAGSDKEPIPIINSKDNEEVGKLSPDARWLAFVSNQSGKREVYITPFPGPARHLQISLDGGTEPVWSPNGKELFYRQGNKMIAAALEIDSTISVAKRTVLFEKNDLEMSTYGATRALYDIHPNGEQFVMIKKGQRSKSELIVVLNWVEELKKLLPAE